MTRSSGASWSVIHKKGDKVDGCQQIVGNSNRMVTRSASKALLEKTDLSGHMLKRQCSNASSRVLTRKVESHKAKKKKLENSVLSDCSVNQPKKRITRRLDSELDKAGCDLIPLHSSTGGAAVRKSQDEIGEERELIGAERNRGKTRLQGNNQDWTKDQEAALQNAYFTAKPSPHFWKKVAKLVTGKTAQQCFDKMNSNIQTLLSTQPLSRVRKRDSPLVLSYSASKLFKSTVKQRKKTRKTKQKSHISHRNVSHLLQKYSHVNQDSETDLFSVLEPTVNPSTEAFLSNSEKITQKHKLVSIQNKNSPSNRSFFENVFDLTRKKSNKTGWVNQKSHVMSTNVRNLLQKSGHVDQDSEPDLFSVLKPAVNCSGEAYQHNLPQSTPMNKWVSSSSSSLSHKKRLSRFSGVSGTPLTSPPVLKKVKNLALHKYIDQLHMREAKRKVASARYLKDMRLQKNDEENPVAAKDVIKAAKDALCSDAKDVIHKFQQSQADLTGSCSDSEERFCSDEDDAEEITL